MSDGLLQGFLSLNWFLKKIVLPFSNLVGAFEHLSRGDLSRRVEVSGRDEISKLAHSFENIRQELKGLIGNVMQNSARVTNM